MTAGLSLSDLRALLAAATARPWKATHHGYSTKIVSSDELHDVVSVDHEWDANGCEHWVEIDDDNSALMVAAVNGLEKLLDRIEKLELVAEAAADEHDGGCDPEDECETCAALAALDGAE